MQIKIIGSKIHYLSTIDSTNNYTIQKIRQNDILEGEVVLVENQTAGRGQKGNNWESESKSNLTFSVYLRPHFLVVQKIFLLNMFVSVAMVKFLEKKQIQAKIKWPNDILVDKKKICGILIENILRGNIVEHSVLGVGLNVNQKIFFFTENKSIVFEPTSMMNIKNNSLDIKEIFSELLEELNTYYLWLKNSEQNIVKMYKEYLFQLNVKAPYIVEGKQILAEIIDVGLNGELILEYDSKNITINQKEIIFL